MEWKLITVSMERIQMKTRLFRTTAVLAVLLPLAAYAVAGSTSFSSYLQRIPAAPLTAAEAYAKANPITGSGYRIPDFVALTQALNDEAALAQSQQPAAMPAPLSQADAERLAAKMQSMSDAEKMAMALQMAGAANPAMQGGPMSAADTEFTRLLGDHQDRAAENLSKNYELSAQIPSLMQGWAEAHGKLEQQMQSEVAAVNAADCNVRGARVHAIKLNYANQQEQLVAEHLPLAGKVIASDRALVNDQVQFVDQLAAKAKSISSPIAKGGWSQARSFACSLLISHMSMSEQVYSYGAEWRAVKLERQKPYVPVDCGLSG